MKRQILTLMLLLTCMSYGLAQNKPMDKPNNPGGAMQAMQEDNFYVDVNHMDDKTRSKLNRVAADYRTRGRNAFADIGKSMLTGGVTSVFTVIGNEILSLTKVRSQQKKKWEEMRQRECLFVDSLQSVKGQSDFYRQASGLGPLDPTNMNFDGITFRATRNGKDVLKMVCHIDTLKLDHMFLHSKFYLVLDTIVFHPYQSYLPNLTANRIFGVSREGTAKENRELLDYWNVISKFSFGEQKDPAINIRIDLSSSWINEAVQVYQDVKLGSFSVNIPIQEMDLKDSVYFYSRHEALAKGLRTIDITGDCFVVPRSYMPGEANSPSWGTGEYKMKVVMSESCRYDSKKGRSSNWHKDYKQLVRLQNHGKAKNEYITNVISTFKESRDNIFKATYTPLLTAVQGAIGFGSNTGGAAAKMGAMGGMSAAGQAGAAAGQAPQGGGQGMPQKP